MNPQIGFLLHQAVTSLQNGQGDAAQLYLQQALRIQSNEPNALRLLGVIAAQNGLLSQALDYLLRSLKVMPNNPQTFSNLGNVYCSLRQLQEASNAYQKAIRLDSNDPEIWSNWGIVHYESGDYQKAIDCYDHALKLDVNHFNAICNKANALNQMQQYEQAVALYEQAISLNPQIDWAYGSWLLLTMKICRWNHLMPNAHAIESRVMAGHKSAAPFSLIAISDNPSLHAKASKIYGESEFPPDSTLGPIADVNPHPEKIRIGYYSADFHNHATGYLLAELIELHDRNRFEIFGISFGVKTSDAMKERLNQAFDHFVDVSDMSDEAIAKWSRDQKIDIAVDLKGYTHQARTGIFGLRAAPIQVNYLGFPGSMQLPYIDYIIADPVVIPQELEGGYSEKIVYLPNSYQVNDRQRQIADIKFSKAQCGLPENGFVFCCFNNSFKIIPPIFDVWMRVLQNVSGSVMWLLEDNAKAAENLRMEAKQRGINPERLIFAPRMPLSEHLARHHLADLFIDTFPCNAHTTASDALWAGLPVVTLTGHSFASRVAASLLNAIDLPELITTNIQGYEDLLIELGNNPDKVHEIKQKLQRNRLNTPLFDTPSYCRHLESAYEQMMVQKSSHSPLAHIVV